MLGKAVGQYRISKKIGAGGMGVVYLAEHTLLGRQAAVKLLLPEFTQDRIVVSRFFNEARAATSIRHPGIVEIYDFGFEADGAAFIVMEYLQGETLTQRAKRGLVSYDGALAIVRQIASALAAAHNKGIVHRDLKPDNIFLVPDPDVFGGERIKLLDFGIAKLADDPRRSEEITRNGEEGEGESGEGRHLTRTGAVMGTPAYMAPEQCRGVVVDHRADLYSLGCILFRLCTGRPPFVGAGVGDVLAAHIHVPAPSIASIRPDVPNEVERLVQRLLVKDPTQRLGSAEEVIAAIEQANSSPAYRTSAQMPGIFIPPGMPAGMPSGIPGGDSDLTSGSSLPIVSVGGGAIGSPIGTIPAIPSRMSATGNSGLANATGPSGVTVAPPLGGPALPEQPTMSTLSEGASAGAVAPPIAPLRSSRRWMVIAGAVATAGVVAVVVIVSMQRAPRAPGAPGASGGEDQPPAASAATPTTPNPVPSPDDGAKTAEPAPRPSSEPAAVPATEAPATIELTIDSVPAGATLTLDGAALGRTPYHGTLPRADRTATLLVRLSGYKEQKLDVSAAAPITRTVKLEKKRGRATGHGRNDSVNPF